MQEAEEVLDSKRKLLACLRASAGLAGWLATKDASYYIGRLGKRSCEKFW